MDSRNGTEGVEKSSAEETAFGSKGKVVGGAGQGRVKKHKKMEEWEIDLSKLDIRHVIAHGTYGTVYRGAYDGQDVAVKILDWGEDGIATAAETAALRVSFQQEVAVWHKLDHPNIPKFVGASMGTSNLRIPTKSPSNDSHNSPPSRACCVLDGKPYNRKCDVYSFGICLWEIYCCDMPYPNLSFADVSSAVVRQNLRPEIPRCCPTALASVMRKCWDVSPDKRPEMEEVVKLLYAIDTSKGGGMIPEDQATGCFCFGKRRGP
ncbi:Serine/threonine-protein kinase STY8 [Prunus yedoensis var. nudiflora]|uniref:Serine/threonine-protein kinase STY8 n=1 Tax=Prunus yedoensis var. nudiflora TaxID=2094558 RepID=A0A314ZC88_PRUYE|nr:Serine/threonine-protein kinase STY8 [Prunus yedoensis var. nudiflora]